MSQMEELVALLTIIEKATDHPALQNMAHERLRLLVSEMQAAVTPEMRWPRGT
jgi:hypothetical protein